MFQVILVNDEKFNKNYYYSYVESENTSFGNISTDTLPPYQDINKARACYYVDNEWVLDEEKYAEILKENEELKEAQKEAEAEAEATLTSEEISAALLDLADMVTALDERLTILEGEE